MLSSNKITALKMFVASRLSGKYANKIDDIDNSVVISSITEANRIEEVIDSIYKDLDKQGYTVDVLNRMPDSYITSYIHQYYVKMLQTYEKWTKINVKTEDRDPDDDSDVVIEAVIGVSLLAALEREKDIELNLEYDFLDILSKFEDRHSNGRNLVFRMHRIADDIFNTINSFEPKKPKRVSKVRKKKRR